MQRVKEKDDEKYEIVELWKYEIMEIWKCPRLAFRVSRPDGIGRFHICIFLHFHTCTLRGSRRA